MICRAAPKQHLIDYTPEIEKRALNRHVLGNHFAPLFNPPTHQGNAEGAPGARICPGDTGGVNITGPAAADPVAGVIFITSHSGCGTALLAPGSTRDDPTQTGKTIVDWVRGGAAGGGDAEGGAAAVARCRGAAAATWRRVLAVHVGRCCCASNHRWPFDLEGTGRQNHSHRSEYRGTPLDDSKR